MHWNHHCAGVWEGDGVLVTAFIAHRDYHNTMGRAIFYQKRWYLHNDCIQPNQPNFYSSHPPPPPKRKAKPHQQHHIQKNKYKYKTFFVQTNSEAYLPPLPVPLPQNTTCILHHIAMPSRSSAKRCGEEKKTKTEKIQRKNIKKIEEVKLWKVSKVGFPFPEMFVFACLSVCYLPFAFSYSQQIRI